MSNPFLQPSDLPAYGLPAPALGAIPLATQQIQCDVAAGDAMSSVRTRGQEPLLPPYPPEFIGWVGAIAAYNLARIRGFNPQNDGDKALLAGFVDAKKCLDEVQRQARHPNFIWSTDNAGEHMQPTVITSSVVDLANGARMRTRGW